MIPNITRGQSMHGLVSYLAGPFSTVKGPEMGSFEAVVGADVAATLVAVQAEFEELAAVQGMPLEGRAGYARNQHEGQRVVAGSAQVETWYLGAPLDRKASGALATHLDAHRRALGVEVPAGHVWHCSLSLHRDEGVLTDDQWRTISHEFLTRMGILDPAKADVRWVAIRHGLSGANGNDHAHLAVNWVREDGTKLFIRRDWAKAQEVCRDLEDDLWMQRRAGRGAAQRGLRPGELERAQRRAAEVAYDANPHPDGRVWAQLTTVEKEQLAGGMAVEVPRRTLERLVRGAAAAAGSEAEFVRRMRAAGLTVRPSYRRGQPGVQAGYAVSLRDSEVRWYRADSLAKDLRLGVLRAQFGWAEDEPAKAAAAAEWSAATAGRPVADPGLETQSGHSWALVTRQLGQMHDDLRVVSATDREGWARAAASLSGAFAVWSEQEVGEQRWAFARAAEALGRYAAVRERTPVPAPSRQVSVAGTAMLAASLGRSRPGPQTQVQLLVQALKLARAVHDVQVARGEFAEARRLLQDVRGTIGPVLERLSDPVARPTRVAPDPVVAFAGRPQPAPKVAQTQPPQAVDGQVSRVPQDPTQPPEMPTLDAPDPAADGWWEREPPPEDGPPPPLEDDDRQPAERHPALDLYDVWAAPGTPPGTPSAPRPTARPDQTRTRTTPEIGR